MLFMIGIGSIDDMDQEIHILTFFQGRLKARYQLCWQVLNKANRIGQGHLQIAC